MLQQPADWIYQVEKTAHHDLVRYIMELLLITTCVLSILQCTCKYQEPRTPHPQAMITGKKKMEIKLINDVWVTADFG